MRPSSGQGVNLHYQHKVTRTYPSLKSRDGAKVVFTDLAKRKEYTIDTGKAVLNLPAEVNTIRQNDALLDRRRFAVSWSSTAIAYMYNA